jgi:hypothetical protein
MSLNISQYPASASLAQSPMAFTVFENTGVVYSSSFQYYADLYYWTGSASGQPAVPEYTLTKYPNDSLRGIFDVSRIMNSTLTELAFANSSNVKYYTVDFYWQYLGTGGYVSGSHVTSGLYKALDGYAIFQEPINQQVYSKTPYWPLMTDGPVTQSFLDETNGWMTCYTGNVGTTQPTKIVYNSDLGSADYALTTTTATSGQTDIFPIGPLCSDFPLSPAVSWFSVRAYNGSTPLGASIRFDDVCLQKYPNVRIKWKNRYGQFDYYNFLLVNRQGFQSTKRTYQPQLGTWQGTGLSYQNYDSSNLNYLSDSKQTLSVNSDYVDDDYNNIIKQLLVSDEIYWVYEQNSTTETVRPITIRTDSIVFKTGVNDKLVQYGFDFDWGQSYKLII